MTLDTTSFEHPGFKCTTCDKLFKRESHLNQHMKVHDNKQWECDVCKKTFTTKYFLKKHKRLHTGLCHPPQILETKNLKLKEQRHVIHHSKA